MTRRKKRRRARLFSLLCILLISAGIFGYLTIVERYERGEDLEEIQTETPNSSNDHKTTENQEDAKTNSPKEKDGQKETVNEADKTISEEEALEAEVASLIGNMTLEEKVAQLFMITPEALTGYTKVTAASAVTQQALQTYPVGGIIFFEHNVVSPEQLSGMTANLNAYAMEITGLPIFIGIDEEGGTVARIAKNANFDVPKFPDMSEIGASNDTQKAYEVGAGIGTYLKQYGVNVDFAPVADVLTNTQNQVVRKRSFGSDPSVVAAMDLEVIRGMQEKGVLSCLKHFPGHGGTSGDTHNGYSYTEKTLDELKNAELVPFQKGILAGVSFIMVSHIAAPNVTGDQVPASLSEKMVTDVLRMQMGYDGIVITDAMNMGAVVNEYDSKSAAVAAIRAGVDLILMPKDFKSAYQGVLDAVNGGEIAEERIDQSVRRIFLVKKQM